METVTNEEKEFTVTNEDGTISHVTGTITTTDHGVTDEHGHTMISKNITVHTANLMGEPGQNG